MAKYIIDTNFFITCYNTYYCPEIVPTFLENIEEKIKSEDLRLLNVVAKELAKKGDDLSDWVKQPHIKNLYEEAQNNPQIFKAYTEISNAVINNTTFLQAEKDRFLRGADPWIIAYCKEENAIVVTAEVKVPRNSKKVKIPNICEQFGVDYISIIDFMKKIDIQFM